MKLSKLLFVIVPMTFALISCENAIDEPVINDSHSVKLKSKAHREIPFSAKFVTKAGPDAFKEMCSSNSQTDFWGLDQQIGGGNATHLGKFTTDMTFCFHVVLGEAGPDFENGFGEVIDGQGYFEAANGDRLFLSLPTGKVNPSQVPGYIFEFDDTYYFNGGTGRFKGASGQYSGHGLVREDGTGTDHLWEGTLILPNGSSQKD